MKVCITGKINSGKSTLSNYLIDQGFIVIIIDEFINQMYLKNNQGWLIIKELFSNDDIYDEVGNIDKSKMRFFFSSNDHRINELMIKINELIFNKISSLDHNLNYFIELGSYLAFEKYFSKLFDYVILIKTNDENIIKRSNLDLNTLSNHPGFLLNDNLIKANLIIYNNNSKKEFIKQISKINFMNIIKNANQ